MQGIKCNMYFNSFKHIGITRRVEIYMSQHNEPIFILKAFMCWRINNSSFIVVLLHFSPFYCVSWPGDDKHQQTCL